MAKENYENSSLGSCSFKIFSHSKFNFCAVNINEKGVKFTKVIVV